MKFKYYKWNWFLIGSRSHRQTKCARNKRAWAKAKYPREDIYHALQLRTSRFHSILARWRHCRNKLHGAAKLSPYERWRGNQTADLTVHRRLIRSRGVAVFSSNEHWILDVRLTLTCPYFSFYYYEWSEGKQICWQRFLIGSLRTFSGTASRIMEKIAKSVGRINILARKVF